MHSSRRRRLGRWGEWVACAYLRLRGYRILARNFETPYAEIDLLARRGDDLVVIEVKSRRRGTGDWLSSAQSQRLARAATWAHARWGPDLRVRIDVIALVFPLRWLPVPIVRHIRAAVGEM